MSRTGITVTTAMTKSPTTVKHDDSLTHAMDLMAAQGIRHLPVLKGAELFGVLSDRDVKSAHAMRGADPKRMKVEDVCAKDAYVTHPEAHLKYVAKEMAEKHYGSCVVMNLGAVAGIVTTTDLARVLSEILE